MANIDDFSEYYKDVLDSTYDCVDRIVLNAYFQLAQSDGGFRVWWQDLMGNDDNLDNTHLMRFAGHFSRRVHAYAQREGIPLIHCQQGERKHEVAEEHIPQDPLFRGVFCILVSRAPAPVRDVQQFSSGGINITRKIPQPYVNHYSFHIMDPEWGHITIKLCPHPPFNAQIILNGHEYVAIQAKKKKISFTKEGNCFTNVSDATGLARIADTMRASCSVGQLVQTCERWIYSACLCFALDLEEQKKSGFHYSYSIYQVEYSRNLLFTRGQTMDQVFHGVIDRTRAQLDIKAVKTIFGHKRRPVYKKHKNGKRPRLELVVERPVYDLTVFKIHYGKLTVKMYSKGEHVLRIEAITHNTKDLRCGKVIERFPQITESLKAILERFMSTLRRVDVSLINMGTLDTWPMPSKVGNRQVAGMDINQPRMRAVMETVVALSTNPRGFTASEVAEKVRENLKDPIHYQPRHASYDLKKLRGKELVSLIKHSQRYEATQNGLSMMAAFLILREKVLNPLLGSPRKRKTRPRPQDQCKVDIHYENIQNEMQNIFEIYGIAA